MTLPEIVVPLQDLERITYYANEIRGYLQRSVESVVQAGMALVDAKAELARGSWTPMLAQAGINPRTAQVLMQVASHPVLSNPQMSALMPSAWSTLAELVRAEPEALEGWIADGSITPETTVAAARDLVKQAGRAVAGLMDDPDEDDASPDSERSSSGPRDDGPRFAEGQDAAALYLQQAAAKVRDTRALLSGAGFRLTLPVAQDTLGEARKVLDALAALFAVIEDEHPSLDIPEFGRPKDTLWTVIDVTPGRLPTEIQTAAGGNTALKAGDVREATLGGVSDQMWRQGRTDTLTLEEWRVADGR